MIQVLERSAGVATLDVVSVAQLQPILLLQTKSIAQFFLWGYSLAASQYFAGWWMTWHLVGLGAAVMMCSSQSCRT
jgi:hypothetical protein